MRSDDTSPGRRLRDAGRPRQRSRLSSQPPPAATPTGDVLAPSLIGRRLGAYRLVAEIGRGGMGIVYAAQRDDDEFDRRAAIKILPAWSAAPVVERFRFERRVLAGLDHPGIAKLLDAGSTDDGMPYLVMELVDGQPIDAWCEAHGTGVRARVALVEKVCTALAYAHQRLVVHRDVKPANILVTAAGEPKLLDFGIATLLATDGSATTGLTQTGHHSFTPGLRQPRADPRRAGHHRLGRLFARRRALPAAHRTATLHARAACRRSRRSGSSARSSRRRCHGVAPADRRAVVAAISTGSSARRCARRRRSATARSWSWQPICARGRKAARSPPRRNRSPIACAASCAATAARSRSPPRSRSRSSAASPPRPGRRASPPRSATRRSSGSARCARCRGR